MKFKKFFIYISSYKVQTIYKFKDFFKINYLQFWGLLINISQLQHSQKCYFVMFIIPFYRSVGSVDFPLLRTLYCSSCSATRLFGFFKFLVSNRPIGFCLKQFCKEFRFCGDIQE